MDWLRDFQGSFREPVEALVMQYWPYGFLIVPIGIWLWFYDQERKPLAEAEGPEEDDVGDGGGDD